jgi:hypothetical protein
MMVGLILPLILPYLDVGSGTIMPMAPTCALEQVTPLCSIAAIGAMGTMTWPFGLLPLPSASGMCKHVSTIPSSTILLNLLTAPLDVPSMADTTIRPKTY